MAMATTEWNEEITAFFSKKKIVHKLDHRFNKTRDLRLFKALIQTFLMLCDFEPIKDAFCGACRMTFPDWDAESLKQTTDLEMGLIIAMTNAQQQNDSEEYHDFETIFQRQESYLTSMLGKPDRLESTAAWQQLLDRTDINEVGGIRSRERTGTNSRKVASQMEHRYVLHFAQKYNTISTDLSQWLQKGVVPS
eukprot:TRINITY_DN17885_c0_g1_i1.p1 TRINITY_DN17885_c0_g1~~TRINITY_DN17885_c0_g1_i1.p1  ORF type:complete len:201 (+),score=26.88 TRINITY_DN17885_c0_g1_i1:26-604(+)